MEEERWLWEYKSMIHENNNYQNSGFLGHGHPFSLLGPAINKLCSAKKKKKKIIPWAAGQGQIS